MNAGAPPPTLKGFRETMQQISPAIFDTKYLSRFSSGACQLHVRFVGSQLAHSLGIHAVPLMYSY